MTGFLVILILFGLACFGLAFSDIQATARMRYGMVLTGVTCIVLCIVLILVERRKNFAEIARMKEEARLHPSNPEPYRPYGKYGQNDYYNYLDIQAERRQREKILLVKQPDPCNNNQLTALPVYPYIMRSYINGRSFETLKLTDELSAFGRARNHVAAFHVGSTAIVSCAKHSRTLARYSYDIKEGTVLERDYRIKKKTK